MTARVLATKRFSMLDQEAFAVASGDRNPMHMDATYARRTMFGAVVVHGMHGVLWALDGLLAGGEPMPRSLRASFVKPIFVGDDVTATLERDADSRRVVLEAGGIPLTTITLDATLTVQPAGEPPPSADWSALAAPLERAQIAGRGASLPATFDRDTIRGLFPRLAAARDGEAVAGTLALLSRVVGMECPGAQSIFSGVSMVIGLSGGDRIVYRVRRSEPAIAPVEMVFHGPGGTGTISAFYRPKPVAQPACEALRARVAAGEFASQQALVVGGSRGLGELTAKLLALGGADVTITYASGSADADRICEEIREAGGACRAVHLDVTSAGPIDVRDTGRAMVAGYYFATPRISGRRSKTFHPEIFASFSEFYVTAFESFCQRLRQAAGRTPSVFYPSTVFIDEPNRDLPEYSMAKAAGEVLAQHLTQAGIAHVISKRLPRMATDQTAGVVAPVVADSVTVMLEALRGMATRGEVA